MTVTFKTNTPLENELGVQNSHISIVKKEEVSKAEADVIESNALDVDDVYEATEYFDPKDNAKAKILRPTYVPQVLMGLVQENNALKQCIEAMEVNIDGTGHSISLKGNIQETEESAEVVQGLNDFFSEIFPKKSFISVRRELRRDVESVGNGYLEVLRSLSGSIVFINNLDPLPMRLIKLDEAVPVVETVFRFGQEESFTHLKKERRFCQKVGNKTMYFKEFGASRELNKWTGCWETEENPVEIQDRATEVLHFTANEDAYTPYGIPRWINQTPSVLGSRRAEELNLDFFDAGGLPPALVTIMGGELTEPVRKQLQTYLSGKGASKHRAAIIEVQSTGGSLDNPGNVKVAVEKFGSDRQKDSMFEEYDIRCEKRVRSSFRLPPLFVGKTDDYNFASAFASYTVAEAQVFQPERMEFDEIINNTVMKELNPGYVYKSNPVSVNDATQQLKAIELAKPALTNSEYVANLNSITNLDLSIAEGLESELAVPQPEDPAPVGAEGNVTQDPDTPEVKKSEGPVELAVLANTWAASLVSGSIDQEVVDKVEALSEDQREKFDGYVSIKLMEGIDYDMEGSVELMGAASDLVVKQECGCGVNHDD